MACKIINLNLAPPSPPFLSPLVLSSIAFNDRMFLSLIPSPVQIRCILHGKMRSSGNMTTELDPATGGATIRWVLAPPDPSSSAMPSVQERNWGKPGLSPWVVLVMAWLGGLRKKRSLLFIHGSMHCLRFSSLMLANLCALNLMCVRVILRADANFECNWCVGISSSARIWFCLGLQFRVRFSDELPVRLTLAEVHGRFARLDASAKAPFSQTSVRILSLPSPPPPSRAPRAYACPSNAATRAERCPSTRAPSTRCFRPSTRTRCFPWVSLFPFLGVSLEPAVSLGADDASKDPHGIG
jgi:hypothetical protein